MLNTLEDSSIKDWEELEDGELVKRAQSGENEAFGELVRRHRAKVYRYARAYTQESFLAEDIVQDALIRAFMHLGKLVDVERFLPWVHRIVRNQAFSRLNSTAAVKEQSFTALASIMDRDANDSADWNDLDGILRRLNQTHMEDTFISAVPESRLMQKETLRVLTEIIQCLKPRERLIFESHFFEQLSPQEIANLFQLKTANVYQIISRSRKKVIQQKIRVTVDSYIKSRRDLGIVKKTVLTYKDTLSEARTCTSAAESIYKMLQYTDYKLSLPMIMGLTGHAFRINIVPDSVHIAGPTTYNFADVLTRGLKNMGFRSKTVDGKLAGIGPNKNLLQQDQLNVNAMEKRDIHHALPEALNLIHRSLDRGVPVLAWDLFFPEFGIIYGYDDAQRSLFAEECGRKDSLSYDNLGRSVLEEIFVLAIEDYTKVSLREQLQNALQSILEHYDGEEENIPVDSVKGLAGYDVWMKAFENGSIEPNGNAYNIAVVRDARGNAAAFFKELLEIWPTEQDQDWNIRDWFGKAEAAYRNITKHFDKLHERYPFPEGGTPNGQSRAEDIEQLRLIKEEEAKAVGVLRKILKGL